MHYRRQLYEKLEIKNITFFQSTSPLGVRTKTEVTALSAVLHRKSRKLQIDIAAKEKRQRESNDSSK